MDGGDVILYDDHDVMALWRTLDGGCGFTCLY